MSSGAGIQQMSQLPTVHNMVLAVKALENCHER